MRTFDGAEHLGAADQISFVGTCQFASILYDLECFPGAVPEEGTAYGDLLRFHDPQVWVVLGRHEGYDGDREEDSLFVRRRVSLREPADQTA